MIVPSIDISDGRTVQLGHALDDQRSVNVAIRPHQHTLNDFPLQRGHHGGPQDEGARGQTGRLE